MATGGAPRRDGPVALSALFDDALRELVPRAPPTPPAPRGAAAALPAAPVSDGFLYSGNRHESVPRALFLDRRLTPLERNAWQVFRLQLQSDGVTAFPTYDQLRPYLASMPCAAQASHETVARALTLLRLTRWLSLVRRRRDPKTGRILSNLYVLHDEPLTPFEAMQLDPDYLGLVSQALTHAAKAVQIVGMNTLREIAEMRGIMGERRFQREYMNNPVNAGTVFEEKHIRFGKMLRMREYRAIVCYTDPSFKASATADFKATMLVGITPQGKYHVLKAYADQTKVSTMVEWHYDAHDYVGDNPVRYEMEAGFMQDLLLDEFRKYGEKVGYQIPIVGDTRKKPDKFARIEALQPLFERGDIIFNELERDSQGMRVLVEQLLCFEKGSKIHDDAPDALEGAIWKLSNSVRKTNNRYAVGHRASRRW